jgi:hypothetical protein
MQWLMSRTEKDPNYVSPYSHPWQAGTWEAWEYLYKENERLQKANKHLEETFLAQSELIASKSSEIEQLRECQQADGWTINQQSKEIERLREDLRLGMIKAGTMILEKDAEIERLRVENENYLLELRMSGGTVEEIAKMADEKYEEAKRLRELLTDYLNRPGILADPEWTKRHERRVREALGDEYRR